MNKYLKFFYPEGYQFRFCGIYKYNSVFLVVLTRAWQKNYSFRRGLRSRLQVPTAAAAVFSSCEGPRYNVLSLFTAAYGQMFVRCYFNSQSVSRFSMTRWLNVANDETDFTIIRENSYRIMKNVSQNMLSNVIAVPTPFFFFLKIIIRLTSTIFSCELWHLYLYVRVWIGTLLTRCRTKMKLLLLLVAFLPYFLTLEVRNCEL